MSFLTAPENNLVVRKSPRVLSVDEYLFGAGRGPNLGVGFEGLSLEDEDRAVHHRWELGGLERVRRPNVRQGELVHIVDLVSD